MDLAPDFDEFTGSLNAQNCESQTFKSQLAALTIPRRVGVRVES